VEPLVLLLGLAAAAGDIIGGAVVAVPRRISDRTLGLLMALGAGNLLGVLAATCGLVVVVPVTTLAAVALVRSR